MKSWITDSQRSDRLPYYTRANAGEILPDPAARWAGPWCSSGACSRAGCGGFVDFGVYREEELAGDPPPVVGMFGGYFYLNLSHMRLMGIRMGQTAEQIDAAFARPALRRAAVPGAPGRRERGAAPPRARATHRRMLGRTELPGDRRGQPPGAGAAPDAARPVRSCPTANWWRTPARSWTSWRTPSPGTTTRRWPRTVGPAILGPLCATAWTAPTAARPDLRVSGDVDSASPCDRAVGPVPPGARPRPELTALFDQGPAAVEQALDGGGGPGRRSATPSTSSSRSPACAARTSGTSTRGPGTPRPVQALALVDSTPPVPGRRVADAAPRG